MGCEQDDIDSEFNVEDALEYDEEGRKEYLKKTCTELKIAAAADECLTTYLPLLKDLENWNKA